MHNGASAWDCIREEQVVIRNVTVTVDGQYIATVLNRKTSRTYECRIHDLIGPQPADFHVANVNRRQQVNHRSPPPDPAPTHTTQARDNDNRVHCPLGYANRPTKDYRDPRPYQIGDLVHANDYNINGTVTGILKQTAMDIRGRYGQRLHNLEIITSNGPLTVFETTVTLVATAPSTPRKPRWGDRSPTPDRYEGRQRQRTPTANGEYHQSPPRQYRRQHQAIDSETDNEDDVQHSSKPPKHVPCKLPAHLQMDVTMVP